MSTNPQNSTSEPLEPSEPLEQTEAPGLALYRETRERCLSAMETNRRDTGAGSTQAYDALSVLKDAELADPSLSTNFWFLFAQSRVYFTLAHSQERQSEYGRALQFLEQAREVLEAALAVVGDDPGRCDARLFSSEIFHLCATCYERTGDYSAALLHRRQQIEIQKEAENTKALAQAMLGMANIYYRLADYPTTLTHYQDALTLFQSEADRRGEGSAWNGIANVQYSQGMYEGSLESYLRALSIFEELGDAYWEAGVLGNIAGVYNELKRYAEARDCCLRSLVLRTRIGDRHGQAFSHNILARTYLEMNRAAKGKESAQRSLSLFQEINDRSGMAYAKFVLGRSFAELGDFAQALKHYQESLALAEEVGLREIIYQMHERISDLYATQENFEQALTWYKRFHQEKEALFNEENNQKLNNLRTRFEVAQAQRDSELYREHNAQLEEANRAQAALLQQLQEKSAELERLARTDPLTGLLNRRHFETLFHRAFYDARKRGEPLSVALFDVDHFKAINDRFSHATGDAVLRTIATLFQRHCRPGDIVGRYGGEEFALVFPGCHKEQAAQICEEIRAAIASFPWSDIADGASITEETFVVTVSAGLSDQTDVPRPDRMLSEADTRLYSAKTERNRICAA
ncbi:MAG: hypothetical protein OHK0029_14950 [Armatimonadaceae bacterium]